MRHEGTPVSQDPDRPRRGRRRWVLFLALLVLIIGGLLACLCRFVFEDSWPEALAHTTIFSAPLVGAPLGARLRQWVTRRRGKAPAGQRQHEPGGEAIRSPARSESAWPGATRRPDPDRSPAINPTKIVSGDTHRQRC